MRKTYFVDCAYSIAKGNDPFTDEFETLSDSEIHELEKTDPDAFKNAFTKLSSEHLFGGEDLGKDEYTKHLSSCLFPGTLAAKIRYHQKSARCSLTFDHILSEEEWNDMHCIIANRMMAVLFDPVKLFTVDGNTYWIST